MRTTSSALEVKDAMKGSRHSIAVSHNGYAPDSRSAADPVTAGGTLAIGDVSRIAGLRPSAIRYYESLGLLPKPRREGGQRRYDADVLEWLSLIALARE